MSATVNELSRQEIAHHIATRLLSKFSDKQHPGLREPQIKPFVYKETGVAIYPHYQGDEGYIPFQFYITDYDSRGRQISHMTGINFDLRDFNRFKKRYLENMMFDLKKRYSAAYERHSASFERQLMDRLAGS